MFQVSTPKIDRPEDRPTGPEDKPEDRPRRWPALATFTEPAPRGRKDRPRAFVALSAAQRLAAPGRPVSAAPVAADLVSADDPIPLSDPRPLRRPGVAAFGFSRMDMTGRSYSGFRLQGSVGRVPLNPFKLMLSQSRRTGAETAVPAQTIPSVHEVLLLGFPFRSVRSCRFGTLSRAGFSRSRWRCCRVVDGDLDQVVELVDPLRREACNL